MIICKIFLQFNGNSFQRKPKVIANPIFCNSVMFVSEIVFISEQTTENSFGGFLEISDKFMTKLNV